MSLSSPFTIRELTHEDAEHFQELLDTLTHLSEVEAITKVRFCELVDKVRAQDGHIFVCFVAGKIVSCATILIEQKIIRGGACAGHVEDVVTRVGYEGRGYASRVLEHILHYARERGCYKVVLYCKENLEGFYTRIAFQKKGISMEYRPAK